MAAWMVARSGNPAQGFSASLWIATGMLVLGAVLYVGIARRHPAA
jgi:hypothetical protein